MSSYKTVQFDKAPKAFSIEYFGSPPVRGDEAVRREKESFARGRTEANELHNRQIMDHRSDVMHLQEEVFETLEKRYLELCSDISARLPELVSVLLKRILGNVQIDEKMIVGIVCEVLKDFAPEEEKLQVFLCAEDLALIENYGGSEFNGFDGIQLTADDELGRGDCQVKSRFGLIDAKLETKLNKIEQEILV